MFLNYAALLATAGLVADVAAMYFPPKPTGLKYLTSKFQPGVTISYKQTYICETTPGVKSYSGYVHLPPDPSEGRNYPVNTFFWYFESRKDPANAPLAIFLEGGPGTSSTFTAVSGNGPCIVAEDSKTTNLNPLSWNNEVNMLYLDQPNHVGFSYDFLTNGTLNQLVSDTIVTPQNFSVTGIPAVNTTFLIGTFSSQDPANTANTTGNAALSFWHFAQAWFQEFPEYKPRNDKISIWTESYGGHYGPMFARTIALKNKQIAAGKIPKGCIIHIDTVGIISGYVDLKIQGPYYPQMANNNTYGVQIIPEEDFIAATAAIPTCVALLEECHAAAAALDPNGLGTNPDVNLACATGFGYCYQYVYLYYAYSGRDFYDISHFSPDPFPPKYSLGYLNQASVQQALGVPVNYTVQSDVVGSLFQDTGDFGYGSFITDIEDLLNDGVKIALFHGDRDYQVNWLGGEALSLQINSTLSAGFAKAGYANLVNSAGTTGGVVRQFGSFSFTRVFDAGHQVPFYAPQTSYDIFYRTMFGKDVATGKVAASTTYSTTGPSSSFHIKNVLPTSPPPICYLWFAPDTCTAEQLEWLADGTAIIKDFVLIGREVV